MAVLSRLVPGGTARWSRRWRNMPGRRARCRSCARMFAADRRTRERCCPRWRATPAMPTWSWRLAGGRGRPAPAAPPAWQAQIAQRAGRARRLCPRARLVAPDQRAARRPRGAVQPAIRRSSPRRRRSTGRSASATSGVAEPAAPGGLQIIYYGRANADVRQPDCCCSRRALSTCAMQRHARRRAASAERVALDDRRARAGQRDAADAAARRRPGRARPLAGRFTVPAGCPAQTAAADRHGARISRNRSKRSSISTCWRLGRAVATNDAIAAPARSSRFYPVACLLLGGSTRAHLAQHGAPARRGRDPRLGRARPRRASQSGRPGATLAADRCAALVAGRAPADAACRPRCGARLPGREAIARGLSTCSASRGRGCRCRWRRTTRWPRPWGCCRRSRCLRRCCGSAPIASLAGGRLAPRGVCRGAAWRAAGHQRRPLTSPWYLYRDHQQWPGRPGFFANSNHMATLLVATHAVHRRAAWRQARGAARRRSATRGQDRHPRRGDAGPAGRHRRSTVRSPGSAWAAGACVRACWCARRSRARAGALGAAALLARWRSSRFRSARVEQPRPRRRRDEGYSSRYTSFANSLRAAADISRSGRGWAASRRLSGL